MGISGLLPLLKSIHKPCNLKKFAGQTIGVDAYSWLHKGTVACAIDLSLGKPTQKYVDFCMRRTRMLIHFGVTPFIVFDGDYLPSKAGTEVERAKRREESKKKGLELYRMNKPSQAHLELQKAVEVTPTMARNFIEELKKADIQYVVAPYEADAQLVYLEKKNLIQGMISEDSDLLVFGARRLLTKLDQYGQCIEINRWDFTACRSISLVGWTDVEFRRMAILSGCDYLSSITGMGLKNAYRLVRKYKTIERILQILQFDGKLHVPQGYLDAFRRAELTFMHQWVFCPFQNDIVMMTQLEDASNADDMTFIGSKIEQPVALAVARGDLDPVTKAPISLPQAFRSPPVNHAGTKVVAGSRETPLYKGRGDQCLDSFFKAQRTPLAEIDPNRFTPSPTQAQLLRQAAGVAWDSSPGATSAPTHYAGTRRRSNTAIKTQNNPPVLTGMTAPKRRRLFEDIEGNDWKGPLTNDTGVRSRFFDPGPAKSPDLTLPSISSKRPKKAINSEFQVWSEDSVDEVVAGLPETPARLIDGKPEKLIIFRDDAADMPEAADKLSQQKDQHLDESKTPSTNSTSPSAARTKISLAGNADRAHSTAQIPDRHVTAELASFVAMHKYQPDGLPISSPSAARISRPSSISDVASRATSRPQESIQQTATPLQRLEASALNRSKSYSDLGHEMARRDDAVQKPSTEPVTARTSSQPVPRLPFNHRIGPDATALKGSEDSLIPDSEEDMGDESSNVSRRPKATVDLGRYAFAG